LFLALNAKGGEINRTKQKDRTTTLFSENFFFQIRTIAFAKNPLDSKWENFLRGSFYLAKGKTFEKGGESFKTWKCLSKLYPYTIG
jgi:hypothetical protein